MLPQAHIVHNTPGRTRIKIPGKRADYEYFEKLVQSFKNLPGVTRVNINPITASLLLHHDDALEKLLNHAKDLALYEICALQDRKEEFEASAKSKEQIEREGKFLTSSILFGLSVYQALRGDLLGPASTLFMDAIRNFPKNQRASNSLDVNTKNM